MKAVALNIKEIIERSKDELLVLLSEEYGYRRWFWFPKMDSLQLKKWWKNLLTVDPYFMTPEPLPGDVIRVETEWYSTFNKLRDEGGQFLAHTHCDDDSFLIQPDGVRVFHAGYINKD